MEKVRECGLMSSRDVTIQAWKIGSEEPFVTANHGVLSVGVPYRSSIEADLSDRDTRQRWRAVARLLTKNVKVAL
jgi:hypothetical protein